MQFVIYGLCPFNSFFGREKVKPGVGETDDGDGDAVSIHKSKFLLYGGVGGINWPASRFKWNGSIVVRWEDDKAGRGCFVWEIEEVGDCGARAEQSKVGGCIDVSVDIYYIG